MTTSKTRSADRKGPRSKKPTPPPDRLPPESARPSLVFADHPRAGRTVEIPSGADTTYTAHGYFRYIGKYPPQLVAHVLNKHSPAGPILDPMCGGGTTLTEARLRGIDSIGCDINPVSRLISSTTSAPQDPQDFAAASEALLARIADRIGSDTPLFEGPKSKRSATHKMEYCREYFSEDTLRDIRLFLNLIEEPDIVRHRDTYLMCLLAVARRVSRANIKKMNLEIDDKKSKIEPLGAAVASQIQKVQSLNTDYDYWAKPCQVDVVDKDCRETGLPDESVGAVFLHPPYLTNTAFSEFTQLQLAILGLSHKAIWKRELRCRGSFVHEPDGLRKYTVGWGKTIAEAWRVLRPGGVLVTVVGDGQIDYVRIPIGAMTREMATDCGFELIEELFHLLNNNTGRTQSRRMKGQHMATFRKP